MRDRPILMSAVNVVRTLEGFKTQTRRVVAGKQPSSPHYLQALYGTAPGGTPFGDRGLWCEVGPDYPDDERDHVRCPFGAEGDRLWVRETWYDDNALRSTELAPSAPDRFIHYRADHDCSAWEAGCPCNDGNGYSCWRPSIHMPRWASRITLEITDVRAERLRDIDWHDIRAEGVGCPEHDGPGLRCLRECPSLRRAWVELWDSTNGKRPGCASRDNPWVWALTYKRCEVRS